MKSICLVVFSVLFIELSTSLEDAKECGVREDSDLTPLRRKRDVSTPYPWLAVIYSKRESRWEQICTGTLVSPHIVLTAAHCMEYQDLKNKPTNIKIGLGKSFRSFNRIEPSSIIADVREVVVPEHFKGIEAFYANDLALIDLTRSVSTSKYLMPACFDWGKDMSVESKELGQIVGWWKTPAGDVKEDVLTAKIPVFHRDSCLDSLNISAIRKQVTSDKFCAKLDDTGVASNIGAPASGAGMTVEREGHHYVIGVLSTKLSPQNFLTLSNLTDSQNREWLKQQKNRLDKISH